MLMKFSGNFNSAKNGVKTALPIVRNNIAQLAFAITALEYIPPELYLTQRMAASFSSAFAFR